MSTTRRWDGCEEGLLEPETPQRQAFGVTTRAEVAALAGEGQEELVPAGVAAHPGEPVFEDPAGQVLLDYGGDDGAPVSPPVCEALVVHGGELSEMILEEAIER